MTLLIQEARWAMTGKQLTHTMTTPMSDTTPIHCEATTGLVYKFREKAVEWAAKSANEVLKRKILFTLIVSDLQNVYINRN